MPSALDTVVFPDGTKPTMGNSYGTNVIPPPAGSLLTTLSRYLHHRRWVWAAHSGTHNPLSQEAVARLLSTLTKYVRLLHFLRSDYLHAAPFEMY